MHRALGIFLGNDLEELRHGVGIVSRLIKNVGAHLIRLRFRGARVLQQQRIHPQAKAQLRQLAGQAAVLAQNARQDGHASLRQNGLGGNVRTVAHHHVAGFMGNHPGELRLIFGGVKHPAVHIDVPARQGERVDLRAVDDPELPRILRMVVRGKSHQPLPQAVEVLAVLPGSFSKGNCLSICAEDSFPNCTSSWGE